MPVIRLLLLLLILVGLAAFTLQNWAFQIPLVFLGKQTLVLPLSVWVLGAIAAGALTTLLLTGLFQLSNTLAAKKIRSRVASASRMETEAAASRSSWEESGWDSGTSHSTNAQADYSSATSDRFTDEADFGAEAEEADPVDRSGYDAGYDSSYERDRTNYEVPQEPTASYRSGSSYSYSYKDPNSSGIGRSESVYDADYRVIIPPPQPLEPEDDYGFEDDDDFEDETPRDADPRDWSDRRDWQDREDRQSPQNDQNDDWGDQSWRDKGWGDRPKSDW